MNGHHYPMWPIHQLKNRRMHLLILYSLFDWSPQEVAAFLCSSSAECRGALLTCCATPSLCSVSLVSTPRRSALSNSRWSSLPRSSTVASAPPKAIVYHKAFTQPSFYLCVSWWPMWSSYDVLVELLHVTCWLVDSHWQGDHRNYNSWCRGEYICIE